MSKGSFVHLHNHTEYSLLDGALRIPDLVAAAKKEGMPAVAITDHGNMYGVVDFYKAALAQGIKPILGCEVYVAPESRHAKQGAREDSSYHLVLLAENDSGYKNLMRLVTLGHREGFYYKPRVDKELLGLYHEGLICLSACLGGQIPTLLLQGNKEGAKALALEYNEIFGPGNFFLELQDHGLLEQKTVNRDLAEISEETGIPLVATNDMHYLAQEDAEAHDVLLCIQTAKHVEDADRMRFPGDQFYFKSAEEMSSLFAWCQEALTNTLAIAQRCQVTLQFGTYHLPDYPVPPGHTEATWLRHLCQEKLSRRYPQPTPQVLERMEYELSVIESMGYPSYFLIVWDFCDFAHRSGIPVGPGRGSGAGSIIAYILGITDIDPLPYDLLFERFLNPDRVSMPDFDIDFCYERRGEVIEYVTEKYGRERVAQIITFGTMAARAVVRDVGRALDLSYAETDRIAKLIPEELKMTIDRALEQEPRLKELYQEDRRVEKLINIARKLEGLSRHASTHAAGVVIAKEDLVNYVPLQGNDQEGLTTQLPMNTLEELGLLKMDFLGLRTLTILKNATDMILSNRGMKIELNQIPLDDKDTFALLCSTNTLAVFQLESAGMRRVLSDLQPTVFEDIIALVALFRPGPMEQIPVFIASKHGDIPVSYPHPLLEPVLKETYGVMIYQEQIIIAASVLAGFSLSQADLLRRAIGKKKMKEMKEQRKAFVQGCHAKNGIERKKAEEIYDLMVKFADYGFNKSHSAAYGLVAYYTAYFKAHYPVEFMAATLGNIMANTEKVAQYIDHCRRLGIEMLPPDINESGQDFTVTGDKIRFGLGAVKNLGTAAVAEIQAEREAGGAFTSLADFCLRMNGRCNKRMLENLIKGGCFDSLPGHRGQKLAAMDSLLAAAARLQKQKSTGQLDIFGLLGEPEQQEELPPLAPMAWDQQLKGERDALGIYLSGHPLDDYAELLNSLQVTPIPSLEDLAEGSSVTVAGMAASSRTTLTRTGKRMGFLILEDQYATVEVIIFEGILNEVRDLLTGDAPLLVTGLLEFPTPEEPKLRAEKITILQAPSTEQRLYLKICVDTDSDCINRVLYALGQCPGEVPVYFYFEKTKSLRLMDKFSLDPNPRLLSQLESMLGQDCVVLKDGKNKDPEQEGG